jgi:hypothetical protein
MMLLRGALLLTGVQPLPRVPRVDVRFPAFPSIQISIAAACCENCSRARRTRRRGAINGEGWQT